MALVESGLRDHGWKRCMASLREQLRPEDDTGFHYLNGRLAQLEASLRMAEERRNQSPAIAVNQLAGTEPDPERVEQELAQVRAQPDLGHDGIVRRTRKRSWRKRAKTTRGEAWQ